VTCRLTNWTDVRSSSLLVINGNDGVYSYGTSSTIQQPPVYCRPAARQGRAVVARRPALGDKTTDEYYDARLRFTTAGLLRSNFMHLSNVVITSARWLVAVHCSCWKTYKTVEMWQNDKICRSAALQLLLLTHNWRAHCYQICFTMFVSFNYLRLLAVNKNTNSQPQLDRREPAKGHA